MLGYARASDDAIPPTPMNITATLPFRDLADALRLRLEVIGDTAARDRDSEAHLQRLQRASEDIIRLQAALPDSLDPQFAHYLQRCSYDKALAWLDENA